MFAGFATTFQKSFLHIFLSTFLKYMANVAKRFPPPEFIEILLAMCSGKARHGISGKFLSNPAP